jgi:NAD(P)-dependent dehydrogenase (short-subunit alcohol dehydrogenase family)
MHMCTRRLHLFLAADRATTMEISPLQADLAVETAVQEAFQRAAERYGRLDVLHFTAMPTALYGLVMLMAAISY